MTLQFYVTKGWKVNRITGESNFVELRAERKHRNPLKAFESLSDSEYGYVFCEINVEEKEINLNDLQ